MAALSSVTAISSLCSESKCVCVAARSACSRSMARASSCVDGAAQLGVERLRLRQARQQIARLDRLTA